MQFNSLEYILFLPIVFMIYWALRRYVKAQNIFIVGASYLFYGWWDWRFLILIIFTTLSSYGCGLIMLHYADNRFWQKWVNAINIIVNLSILGFFKYYNFFADSFAHIMNAIGIQAGYVTLNIVLPVGISFYTFQALSYTIDVYKRRVSATSDIVAFAAYISFFPQLVAGPIERASNLLPQFQIARHFDYVKAVDGMRQILWGLFKKVVVADNCAIVVDQVFNNYESFSSANLIWAAVLFSIQIYGDFSGYSDIAIGTAKLFGIELMRNFRVPYFSRDIAEFWRRWHISLNTWFRDYVYIPLGGSRCGKTKILRNTLIVFVLSGLWHGANWTFVCWGLYHALLFIPLILMGVNRKHLDDLSPKKGAIKELLQIIVTFILVTIGWIIFRADNIVEALDYISHIFIAGGCSLISSKTIVVYLIILFIFEWNYRTCNHALYLVNIKYRWLRYVIYYALLALIWINSSSVEQFIYFQF